MLRVASVIALGSALAVLAIGAFGSPSLRADVAEGGPACPLLAATGHPCAFCGMTRATLALGHGDVGAAVAAHPVAPLVLAGVIAIFAIAAAGRAEVLTARRRPLWILAGIAVIWAFKLAA